MLKIKVIKTNFRFSIAGNARKIIYERAVKL